MDFDKITVVINTFHSEDKIIQCLDSIHSNVRVIVIENSDNINFKKKIEKKYSNVQCFLTGENLGYAKGNNLGLSKVKTKFSLILNPDAKLGQEALNNFLISAEKIKDFSIIGPAKQIEDSTDDKTVSEKEFFQVESLKGFAMFLNMDEFKDIGFFDENFFIYLEEKDLCKRIKKRNKKIFLVTNINIDHIGGSSHNQSIDYEMELSRNWHWMWSKFYFNKKHYGYFYSVFAISGNFISAFFKTIFYIIIFNKKKRKIYFQRLSGIVNSVMGKKSWYRPKIIIN